MLPTLQGNSLSQATPTSRRARFDSFEVDLITGELRRNGEKIKLPEQSFQILAMLLAKPGEVVMRQEIQRRLWPNDTVVEFDNSINAAVKNLRLALGDSADQPHYIETLPKRGYRFLLNVSRDGAPSVEHQREIAEVESSRIAPLTARSRVLFALGSILTLACMLAAWAWIGARTTNSSQPEFQRLSFGRGIILSARFVSDGQSVVYGAAWDGKPYQLFWTRIGSHEARSLGIDADLLAVSSSGELAILINPTFRMISRQGTLALTSLTGSAPHVLLDNVQDADWSPDGSHLAITHYVGGHCALESPPGKILYATTEDTWLSNLRFSPRGDQIAFLEHPLGGGDDDAGWLAVIDLAGHKRNLSGEFVSVSGLAWDPSADAIWISGAKPGQTSPRSLLKISTAGKQTLVRQEAGNTTLQDVSRNGQLLLTKDAIRGEVFGRIYPDSKERELGWRDNSIAMDVTTDASAILLSVQEAGEDYEVYLRHTDGSPAVRLGEGLPMRFSPDERWALTTYPSGARPTKPPQLLLLPTGVGQPIALTHDSISHGQATLLTDAKVLFEGREPGRPPRNWVQDVSGGSPVPITPEGTVGKSLLSPDSKLLVAADSERRLWLYPLEGGKPTALSGVEPGEKVIRWSKDGKSLFIANDGIIPVRVCRLEVTTGRRQVLYTLAPADPAGVWAISPVLLTPDGNSYVYTEYHILSDLYLASGLR